MARIVFTKDWKSKSPVTIDRVLDYLYTNEEIRHGEPVELSSIIGQLILGSCYIGRLSQ